jgi:hypothetical protein
MGRPAFELADVLAQHGAEFYRTHGNLLTARHRRVLDAISRCRTAALGAHANVCCDCGGVDDISYNSCRDSHCPKCGGSRRARWLEARKADLLAVPYFHVVFTLPEQVADIALQNKRLLYGLLLGCAAETLQDVARDPHLFGADIGLFTVLHTWGQNLLHHPHAHCVVPGGGLSVDRERWVHSRKNFFLPIAVLRKRFRGKFLTKLQEAYRAGELTLAGRLTSLQQPENFAHYLKPLWKQKWVVYAKPPFGGPEQVLKYLARYTHRVAIANSRLLAVADGKVRFRWRDYRDGQTKVMELDAGEFLRRFSMHIQPKGLQRIRHYGLLANRHKHAQLTRCRRLMSPVPPVVGVSEGDDENASADAGARAARLRPKVCPFCRGRLLLCQLGPGVVGVNTLRRDTS